VAIPAGFGEKDTWQSQGNNQVWAHQHPVITKDQSPWLERSYKQEKKPPPWVTEVAFALPQQHKIQNLELISKQEVSCSPSMCFLERG